MARKEKLFHYIYKITNTKNGKYYIGMHSTDNVEDGYFGSGKRIRNSIRKHGLLVHTKEIIEYFEDRESLRNCEIGLVNEDLLNDPMCMNLQPGGGGGFINEEHRKKCALAAKLANTKHLIEFWKDPINRKKRTDDIKKAMGKLSMEYKKNYASHGFKDKTHTEEAKELIGVKNSTKQKGEGNSQWGSFWVNHPEMGNKKIRGEENLDVYINSGWNRGRNMKFKK